MIRERIDLLAGRFKSKSQFDEALGLSAGTIAKYIRGQHVPGGELLSHIVRVTNCDGTWLLTGDGEPFPTARFDHLQAMRDQLAAALEALDKALKHRRDPD